MELLQTCSFSLLTQLTALLAEVGKKQS